MDHWMLPREAPDDKLYLAIDSRPTRVSDSLVFHRGGMGARPKDARAGERVSR